MDAAMIEWLGEWHQKFAASEGQFKAKELSALVMGNVRTCVNVHKVFVVAWVEEQRSGTSTSSSAAARSSKFAETVVQSYEA